jgi:hypothetical protein
MSFIVFAPDFKARGYKFESETRRHLFGEPVLFCAKSRTPSAQHLTPYRASVTSEVAALKAAVCVSLTTGAIKIAIKTRT